MRNVLLALLLFIALSSRAATTNNDDSCDISMMPAATLLLPYFEVDLSSPQSVARTTLFTVINTSARPQIARVTLWTDWSFPVLTFNIFLTGYDVQSINLYDILGGRGVIAPPSGTGTAIGIAPGSRSLPNTDNPNFLPNAGVNCNSLPGVVPAPLIADIRNALTLGRNSACGTARIGGTHTNAIGYATIDVMATCGVSLPTDPHYYNELLYDNVLGGDWQVIEPNATTGNYAGGNPLVHIRAIPEGGPAGVITRTNLPYTFYNRFTPRTFDRDSQFMDRRQPLPSAFAARYVQGGTGAFDTDLRIWREAVTGADQTCASYAANGGTPMRLTDIVRFDEHENPTTISGGIVITLPPAIITLPAASSTAVSSAIYPLLSPAAGDTAGWLYLNLNNSGSSAYTTKSSTRPSQNWVTGSMSAEGRFAAAFDATVLGNGCSPAPAVTNSTSIPIAPLPNTTP